MQMSWKPSIFDLDYCVCEGGGGGGREERVGITNAPRSNTYFELHQIIFQRTELKFEPTPSSSVVWQNQNIHKCANASREELSVWSSCTAYALALYI